MPKSTHPSPRWPAVISLRARIIRLVRVRVRVRIGVRVRVRVVVRVRVRIKARARVGARVRSLGRGPPLLLQTQLELLTRLAAGALP